VHPAAGAGAGSTLTALLAYLLSAHRAPSIAEVPLHACSCASTPEPGYSDDWERLASALSALPFDYLICALFGVLSTLALDIFYLVKTLIKQARQDSQPKPGFPRRPEFLALDVTRGA